MSGFDVGRIYTSSGPTAANGTETTSSDSSLAVTEQNLYDFVQRFRTGNDYIYRDRLRSTLLSKQNVLDVSLQHIQLWSAHLAQSLREKPTEVLPLVSRALIQSEMKWDGNDR